MKITLPGKVTEIIENLQMHGYEHMRLEDV